MSSSSIISDDLRAVYGVETPPDRIGLPSYSLEQRGVLLREAYRLHFIYNAVHKMTAPLTLRELAALPIFFENYDVMSSHLAAIRFPFVAEDPCVQDPARLAALAGAFFAGTYNFWHHPRIASRKAQMVARESYLGGCPRIAAGPFQRPSSSSSAASASAPGPYDSNNDNNNITAARPGIIAVPGTTTVAIADMEALHEALERINANAIKMRDVLIGIEFYFAPDHLRIDTLADTMHEFGDKAREILQIIARVSNIFVEGGFQ